MVKLVNHQYSVPTIFQWVNCISILKNVLISFYVTIMRLIGMALSSMHPYCLHNDEHSRKARKTLYKITRFYHQELSFSPKYVVCLLQGYLDVKGFSLSPAPFSLF